jgi:hypothetical protein
VDLIHATNAWNPTGRNLHNVPGTRLYFSHAETSSGPRTFVLLGSQRHLTFVADAPGHVASDSLRELVLSEHGVYPHQVDLEPAAGLPHLQRDREREP